METQRKGLPTEVDVRVAKALRNYYFVEALEDEELEQLVEAVMVRLAQYREKMSLGRGANWRETAAAISKVEARLAELLPLLPYVEVPSEKEKADSRAHAPTDPPPAEDEATGT